LGILQLGPATSKILFCKFREKLGSAKACFKRGGRSYKEVWAGQVDSVGSNYISIPRRCLQELRMTKLRQRKLVWCVLIIFQQEIVEHRKRTDMLRENRTVL
jgi:hypothetical protein